MKHAELIAQPSLIRVAFRRSWYHIEGRGHHTTPLFLTAFWYRVFVIPLVIIIAILVFSLDVNLAEENMALHGTLVSNMGASVCGPYAHGLSKPLSRCVPAPYLTW